MSGSLWDKNVRRNTSILPATLGDCVAEISHLPTEARRLGMRFLPPTSST